MLSDVYVDPRHRDEGYGTKIVEHIINEAKIKECYKLISTSRDSREIGEWYESLGFKKHSIGYRMDLDQVEGKLS